MKRWVVGDFETASAVDLKQAGAWRYAQDPSTEVLCFAWDVQDSNLPRVWMAGASMEEVRETAPLVILDPDRLEYFINALCTDTEELRALASDPDVIWIAHNAAFEKAIWRHIMEPEFGMPPIPNTRWHDTQAVCAHRALPQKLDTVLQVLQLEHQKDMEGSKITLGMSKPDRKGYYNRSLTKRIRAALYCLDDIAGEVGLHRRLGWLPAMEQTVWLLNQRTNERGLKLDMDFVRQAQKVVDDASRPLLAEFSTLTGGFTPGQGKELHKWLAKHDVTLPNLTKETIAEMIGDDEGEDEYDNLPSPVDDAAPVRDLPDVVRRALRIKQLVGSASVKKLRRMEACVSLDGRARGLSQYHGSTPGRNTGRLLQPYNFPRGTLKIKGKDGKEKAPEPQLVVDAIMTGDYGYVEDALGAGAVEVVVSSLRHALVPNAGRVFISGDYAGIQARVVLAVAQQADKLSIFSDDCTGRKGADIYCDMAGQIYKRPITKNDMAERQTGKNSVLGLGFQMGWKKFRLKYAKDQSPEFAEEIVRVYRKEWAPKVPDLWYGLQRAAVKCVHTGRTQDSHGIEYRMIGDALTARLPSGRLLWYQHPVATQEPMPWDVEDVRAAFAYHVMKMGQWKRVKAFGGLLTENVVMGIEVDIQRTAQIKCEKAGFPVVLEVYDEVVVEPEIANADEKGFRQILLDVEPWVKQLEIPIAVETWTGDRYRK